MRTRHREVVGLDPQLFEALAVGELLGNCVAASAHVPCGQYRCHVASNSCVGVSSEKVLLPSPPGQRRALDREDATILIEVEHARDGLRQKRLGQRERPGLGDGTLPPSQPLFLDA